jgi:transglutaminase-like putative cysteine protease
MRLHIAHSTVHRYTPPAIGAIQVLRLTPRSHEGQYVIDWRIDVSADARLAAHEDAFGNLTHVFTANGPLDTLTVGVEGEVETHNMDGIVRGTVERFPPSLFLRETALTHVDQPIIEFARSVRAVCGGAVLAELHAMLDRLHAKLAQDTAPAAAIADAAAAFAGKPGGPDATAHIFIAAARSLGIPARFVSGYLCPAGAARQDAGHSWAEAFVPDLGWVGFDPTHGVCPTDGYVRVAIGLDALGAAPVRGTRYGNGAENREVAITVGQ